MEIPSFSVVDTIGPVSPAKQNKTKVKLVERELNHCCRQKVWSVEKRLDHLCRHWSFAEPSLQHHDYEVWTAGTGAFVSPFLFPAVDTYVMSMWNDLPPFDRELEQTEWTPGQDKLYISCFIVKKTDVYSKSPFNPFMFSIHIHSPFTSFYSPVWSTYHFLKKISYYSRTMYNTDKNDI